MSRRVLDDDLAYGERWDRDRFLQESDRNRYGEREHLEEHERYYSRGPPRERPREPSVDIDERFERRKSRPYEEDEVDVRVREKKYYDEEPERRYRRHSPDTERRIFYEKERERHYAQHSPSPPPRRGPPTLLRRQSSLDTFDRRPPPRFFEHEEEYGPPARREGYRPDPYEPIPLPRSRALPPPRVYAERDFEEIQVAEPDRYGEEHYRAWPDHLTEKGSVKSKKTRGSGSRTSKARSRRSGRSTARSSSRSSTTSSSSSSSSGGTTVTVKSEYPKKGKTRIPARLVSKRAIIDLGYPYIEEGNTIVVQKALGQQNIDDLLKLSDDYKKAEEEVGNARSVHENLIEERREEVFTIPPPPPTVTVVPPPPASVAQSSHHTSHHPSPPPPPPAPATAAPMEVVRETMVREVSPARSYTTCSTSTGRTPIVYDAAPREYSEGVPLGPLAIVGDRRRSDKEIKMEIARLEAERDIMRQERHRHHSHSHSRHRRSHSHGLTDRELVRTERLPTGELVVYQEEVEKIEEPRRGVRIEKDKRGPPPGLMRAMLATLT
ncbi:hypothetical protein F4780DRAFT_793709 [Xylariomycetidae sp. FL0641]|nr:hypothetical protein F4780DRAFT_793709 [Xylariomycetidae sp. FL0641]